MAGQRCRRASGGAATSYGDSVQVAISSFYDASGGEAAISGYANASGAAYSYEKEMGDAGDAAISSSYAGASGGEAAISSSASASGAAYSYADASRATYYADATDYADDRRARSKAAAVRRAGRPDEEDPDPVRVDDAHGHPDGARALFQRYGQLVAPPQYRGRPDFLRGHVHDESVPG